MATDLDRKVVGTVQRLEVALAYVRATVEAVRDDSALADADVEHVAPDRRAMQKIGHVGPLFFEYGIQIADAEVFEDGGDDITNLHWLFHNRPSSIPRISLS